MTVDPVCRKEVNPAESLRENFEGHEFFFCSEKCREEFNQHPDRYAAEGLRAGVQYPMGITQ